MLQLQPTAPALAGRSTETQLQVEFPREATPADALRQRSPQVEEPARPVRGGFRVDSASPNVSFPAETLRKWQRIVDLLARFIQVPSAVLTKLEPPHESFYRIVSSSTLPGNPFAVDEIFAMDIGTFCETVIKDREPLLVVDASQDPRWQHAPELQVGMVSYLGFPVLWPDGRVFGTICVLDVKSNAYNDVYQELLSYCRDVLQEDLQTLVSLGNELDDQRAHLSELFARVPEALVMVDHEFRITQVNPEFTKIFGFTAAEAVGRFIKELITPDELQDEVEDFRHRMIEASEVFAVETVRRHKDGTHIPVSVLCVPVPTQGAKAGYVIYRDLSESRRLQHEQKRFHEIELELAHANRKATLGLLSASIAHELNQPLSGIVTNSSACLRALASHPEDLERVRAALARTLRDCERATEVTARLRALFSKNEHAYESVDLNETAREVIALSTAEIQSSRVDVQTEFARDLPLVVADRVQLRQVVLNLLRNALEAMGAVDDRPRSVLIKTQSEVGDWVRLTVRDVGIGLDPRIASRIFEAFYSTKKDGMGVGLALSRSIIESHHGRLWGTPNDGPGATFAFSIPCRPPRAGD